MHRLRIIEGLFSMVIPSNMIALHTIHFAGEEHETIWSTVSCISKQHGSRDTRDQTQTTDHLIESLSCYTRSLRLYDLSGQLKSHQKCCTHIRYHEGLPTLWMVQKIFYFNLSHHIHHLKKQPTLYHCNCCGECIKLTKRILKYIEFSLRNPIVSDSLSLGLLLNGRLEFNRTCNNGNLTVVSIFNRSWIGVSRR